MDALPGAAAAAIALHLLDERDLAALQATCRSWRAVFADAALWRTLAERRFGSAAVADGEGAAGSEAAAARQARQRFARLASLKRPATQLDRIIHLNGTHLQARRRCWGHGSAGLPVCRSSLQAAHIYSYRAHSYGACLSAPKQPPVSTPFAWLGGRWSPSLAARPAPAPRLKCIM